ncbi:MAG: DegT/DnrJ/EryC1/StrS family aminotransferase, partial [Nocardiopsaceae bacterium]|nr:DegT/DnrJ/EryC1/StrS family aminotransferase [Nocardiopsaceae bacterium]
MGLTDPMRRWPPPPGRDETAAVTDVLASGVWTDGRWTRTVEQRLADLTGAPHAVAFNSCTSALHAALLAAGAGPFSRITAPAFTFAGTVTGAVHIGAALDFADIAPDTLTIALPHGEPGRAVGIVLAVDLHGVPHPLNRADPRVITDACQALGTTHTGPGDSTGDAAGAPRHLGHTGTHAWSFSAAKLAAAPDGGAVTTGSADLADTLRELRDYGIPPGEPGRPRAASAVRNPGGHNWRPSEITMALVAHRLDTVHVHAGRARQVTAAVHDACDRAGFWRQQAPPGAFPAWHKIRVAVPGGLLPGSDGGRGVPAPETFRRTTELVSRLREAGIPTHVWGTPPLHHHPAFRPAPARRRPAPVAETVAETTVCLGTEACPPWTWTDDEVERV